MKDHISKEEDPFLYVPGYACKEAVSETHENNKKEYKNLEGY